MRIRKRRVPLPLSFLTPVPLSDPLHCRSPTVVQVQLQEHNNHSLHHLAQEADKLSYFDSPPSDQVNQPIGAGCTGQDWELGDGGREENKVSLKKKVHREDEEGKRSNDAGHGRFILGAKIESMDPEQPTSLSAEVQSRWEAENSFSMKKRRGIGLERRSNEEKKTKTKMNKKCLTQNGIEERKLDKETNKVVNDGTTRGKKGARDGAIQEGSRCSRVNGRGWRCCQQTLVGYSLCEHHLGKGRLRSMSTVRSRSKVNKTQPKLISNHSEEENETKGMLSDDKLRDNSGKDEEDEKQPLMISKRKLKVGVVKARTISSLLGQVNDTIGSTDDNN